MYQNSNVFAIFFFKRSSTKSQNKKFKLKKKLFFLQKKMLHEALNEKVNLISKFTIL